jgi:hypothetical protein
MSASFLFRPALTPSLIDESWFPRYDIDEEAMLEAEEADLRKAMKTIRKAKAVQHVGEKQADGDNEGDETEEDDTEGSLSESESLSGIDSD